VSNQEIWDRIAARRSAGDAIAFSAISYGTDLPTDDELRLCGDVSGKRVLDIGSGAGENAIVFAASGAHVIAIDTSKAQLSLGRKLAEIAEVRVEFHESDACDLAFLRADSIDLAFAAGVLGEVDDLDRLLRQVHRVLRPGAAFVFSFDHPMALAVGREGAAPGTLALGTLEVRRSYFSHEKATVTRSDEQIAVVPRPIAEVFAALHRAGYRADMLLEPEPLRSSDPGPAIPTAVVIRARKEGV
jgi:ubiquinone/menaquinone biosynthesis C-methylase UbiE